MGVQTFVLTDIGVLSLMAFMCGVWIVKHQAHQRAQNEVQKKRGTGGLTMEMRDRLIELVCKGIQEFGKSTVKCSADEYIADYLLANGVIVPPCKVGQTVYSFCDVFGAILTYVVQNFGVGFMGKDRQNYWFWEATSHATETDELLDEIDFDLDDFGKTVFLTKEEAEQALKECEGE